MVKKYFIVSLLVFISMLVAPEAAEAGGAKPPRVNLIIIPIDPSPFQRFDDFDLRMFPTNLSDETDNALVEAYTGLGGELAVYQPLEIAQIDEIVKFHQGRRMGGNKFVKKFCESISPEVNVLITFDLMMDPSQISLDHVVVKIHCYHKTGKLKAKQSLYHRNRYLELSSEDYQGIHQKVIDAVYTLIQETSKSFVLKK